MILCGGSDSGEQKSTEHDFKYLYWTISKTLFWNTSTCKGTYMMIGSGGWLNESQLFIDHWHDWQMNDSDHEWQNVSHQARHVPSHSPTTCSNAAPEIYVIALNRLFIKNCVKDVFRLLEVQPEQARTCVYIHEIYACPNIYGYIHI